MSNIIFTIEVYHHGSNSSNDWTFGCPELGLKGYHNLNDLHVKCHERLRKLDIGNGNFQKEIEKNAKRIDEIYDKLSGGKE